MSKILVTGCCGFIGSHLVDRLLSAGFTVIGIDSLTGYYSREIKLNNISPALLNNNFNFYEADITNFNFKLIKNEISFIFHLAAEPGVRGINSRNFGKYVTSNILSTQYLLEEFQNTNINRFIFTSSSSVYGSQSSPILNEAMKPNPVSLYAVTKLAAENLCNLYYQNLDFPVISLRLFTAFGKRQRPDLVFEKIISAIRSNSFFEVYGDGNQQRDYTYIDNIIDALLLAMGRGENGSAINIGSGISYSLNEVIQYFSEISGKKIKIKYIEKALGDIINTHADIKKAENDLGYKPINDFFNQMKIQYEYKY